MSDPFPPDLAHALVAAEPRLAGFARLQYFAEVDSTNDIALSLAAAGASEGTSVLADFQRAGRGRRGRSWFSPPGAGLYLSIVIRPSGLESPLTFVTLAGGVTIAEAVTAVTGLPVELKWPNDLVVGRPWRKLAGLLCESTGTGAPLEAVVLGIGLNLRTAAYPPEIADRASSIETELGRPIDRAPIVVECLAQLRDTLEQLRDGRRDWIREQWRRFGQAGLDGGRVHWRDQTGPRTGRARDIDDDGALVVESDGRLERLIAGEVTWERLSCD